MMALPRARLLGALLRGQDEPAARMAATLDADGWSALLAEAGDDLLSPELAEPLHRIARAAHVPADVLSYLEELRALNAARNTRIAAQLSEMLPAFAAAALSPVLLKGARDVAGRGGALSRVMVDLDLLFARDQLADAALVLERLGYSRVETEEHGTDNVHVVGYFARRGEPAMIDLHHEVLALAHLLPAEALIGRAVPGTACGVPVLFAAPVDDVLHSVLHEMVHHQGLRQGVVSVRGLRDLLLRLHRLAPEDWLVLRGQAAASGVAVPLAAALRLAALVFGPASLPPGARIAMQGGLARIAVWRTRANSRGFLPKAVNTGCSRLIETFAAYNHCPRKDAGLMRWRLQRLGWGLGRLIRPRRA